MPGSIGVGALGWKARAYQPWGRSSILGLALPKVEVPGQVGHPPPLSDAVVNSVYSCVYTFCCLVGKGMVKRC